MFNVWLLMDEDSKDEINLCLATDPADYVGPVDSTMRGIFQTMPDLVTVQGFFKSPVINALTYYLYTIYPDTTDIPTMQAQIDYVTDEYTDTLVGGAWELDGDQVVGYTPNADLLDFMPDVWDGLIPGSFIPAVAVTDVNLCGGQSVRDFS